MKYKHVEEYDQNQKEEQNMNQYSPEDIAMNQNKTKLTQNNMLITKMKIKMNLRRKMRIV